MTKQGLAYAALFALVCATVTGLAKVEAQNAFLGFELLNLDGAKVRWRGHPGQPLTVRYAFVKSPSKFDNARNCDDMIPINALLKTSGISDAAFRKEVRAAFDMWQGVAQIKFIETSDTASAGILIGAQAQPVGRAFANVAYRPQPRKVRDIERSLICLNPKTPWKIGFDGDTSIYDLRYTVAHEIGHAIGLDHAGRSGQLMSYRYDEQFRGLQSGDIAGAVKLYGEKRPLSVTADIASGSGG